MVADVKPLNISMQSLIQQKAADVNINDVEAAKSICSRMNTLYANILEEVGKINDSFLASLFYKL